MIPLRSRSPFHPRALVVFSLLTLVSFAVPAAFSFTKMLGRDWEIFYRHSLVAKSNVLSFGQFPLHDPWKMGGVDIWSDPQSRVFSPMLLLDVLFDPITSNQLAIFIYAFFGLIGMHKLLVQLRLFHLTAFVGAFLFINSSWFTLHFAEGHLSFASIQLFPWIFLGALQIEQLKRQLLLASLFALFLIDGSPYAFVFGMLLALSAVFFWESPFEKIKKLFASRANLFLCGLLFLGLASTKAVPVLLLVGSRHPFFETIVTSPRFLAEILFNPFQHLFKEVTTGWWGFHEYGCYIGLFATGLVVLHLFSRRFLRNNARYLIFACFWLWLASGWGGSWNPWNAFQKVPILNNLHVQSRLLILFFFFFTLLAAKALQRIENRRVFLLLSSVLVLESLAVRTYIFSKTYKETSKPKEERPLISATRWVTGPAFMRTGDNWYFSTNAKAEGDTDYKGEIYALNNACEAKLDSFIPGAVQFSFKGASSCDVQVNTNVLMGWKVVEGPAHLLTHPSRLVTVRTSASQGTVRLRYRPLYFYPLLLLYAAGVFSFFWCLKKVLRDWRL